MRELPKIARERLAAGRVSNSRAPHATPGPGDAGESHPDANVMSAFVERSLLPHERDGVIAHLAACEQCRAEVQLVLAAAPAREDASIRDGASEPRPWWRMLRWQAATAAAALATVSLVFWVATRRPAHYASLPAAPAPATMATNANSPTAPSPAPREEKRAADQLQRSGPVAGPAAGPRAMHAPSAPPAAGAAENAMAQKSGTIGGTARDQATSAPTAGVEAEQSVAGAAPPPRPPPASALDLPSALAKQTPAAAQAAAPGVEAGATAVRGIAGNFAARPAASRKTTLRLAELHARWKVSASPDAASPGEIERSLDGGRSWQPVVIAAGVAFRVVFARGSEVWAGGAAGAFSHSIDAGQHWSAVPLSSGGGAIAGDIISIQFADPAHGSVTASSGETWTTSDGGQTWQRTR